METVSIAPLTRAHAEELLATGSPDEIAVALLAVALHDPDWVWVQDIALQHCRHADPFVRSAAALAFGHLARLHHLLDRQTIVGVLHELIQDSNGIVRSRAGDALNEVLQFLPAE